MGAKERIYNFLSAHPEFRANLGLYKPNENSLDEIRANVKGLKIKIFCADWCPDCRMQLPRFLSVVLALGEENISIEFIEVDRDKKDELGMAERMNVLAVPTFILFRDGEEIGRIIERPKDSMEKDIAGIIKRFESAPAGHEA
ncbi:MAG: thioredoxin family protein [Thermoplasmata archaeon]